jgi:hypothetical protein
VIPDFTLSLFAACKPHAPKHDLEEFQEGFLHASIHPQAIHPAGIASSPRMRSHPLALALTLVAAILCPRPSLQAPQIPSVNIWNESTGSLPFVLDPNVHIVVDQDFQDSGSPGPSLLDYANTFRGDLLEVLKVDDIPQVTVGSLPDDVSGPTIFLSLAPTTNHTLFNGQQTEEGYDFEVTSNAYVIRGAGSIGAWWGTHSVLAARLTITDMVPGRNQDIAAASHYQSRKDGQFVYPSRLRIGWTRLGSPGVHARCWETLVRAFVSQ